MQTIISDSISLSNTKTRCQSQQVYVALDKDHKYKLPVIKKKREFVHVYDPWDYFGQVSNKT